MEYKYKVILVMAIFCISLMTAAMLIFPYCEKYHIISTLDFVMLFFVIPVFFCAMGWLITFVFCSIEDDNKNEIKVLK